MGRTTAVRKNAHVPTEAERRDYAAFAEHVRSLIRRCAVCD